MIKATEDFWGLSGFGLCVLFCFVGFGGCLYLSDRGVRSSSPKSNSDSDIASAVKIIEPKVIFTNWPVDKAHEDFLFEEGAFWGYIAQQHYPSNFGELKMWAYIERANAISAKSNLDAAVHSVEKP